MLCYWARKKVGKARISLNGFPIHSGVSVLHSWTRLTFNFSVSGCLSPAQVKALPGYKVPIQFSILLGAFRATETKR